MKYTKKRQFVLLISGMLFFLTCIPMHSLALDVNPGQSSTVTFKRQAERDVAVIEGLVWMAAFLIKEENFVDIHIDAFRIFRESSLTSKNPFIRQWAETMAYVIGDRLKGLYLRSPDPLDRMHFVFMLDFLCEAREMGLNVEPLIQKARVHFEAYKDTDAIYTMPLDDFGALSEPELFDLLILAQPLEKVYVSFAGKIPYKPMLAEVSAFISQKDFIDYEKDTSEDKQVWKDHSYLVTHAVYALCNYCQYHLAESDAPRLYAFLRKNLPVALSRRDVELVGEFVDALRCFGLTEADPMVRQGTEFLLDTQQVDGSWDNPMRPPEKKKRPYHQIHSTWCAVVGLRERMVIEGTEYEKHIRKMLAERKTKKPKRRMY